MLLVSLVLLTLCGCKSGEKISGDIAAQYSGKPLTMTLTVRMTYLGKLAEYKMTQEFGSENSSFKIVEPEVLKGIEAGIDGEGKITFAGIVLVPENLPEGFSVFSLLHAAARSLSSSQSLEAGSEGDAEYRLTREIYIGDKRFYLDQWFDKYTLEPLRFEVSLDGERVLECEYIEFGMK